MPLRTVSRKGGIICWVMIGKKLHRTDDESSSNWRLQFFLPSFSSREPKRIFVSGQFSSLSFASASSLFLLDKSWLLVMKWHVTLAYTYFSLWLEGQTLSWFRFANSLPVKQTKEETCRQFPEHVNRIRIEMPQVPGNAVAAFGCLLHDFIDHISFFIFNR